MKRRPKLKSIEEQFAALDLVAKAAATRVVNCGCRGQGSGDVITLVAYDVPYAHEIVSALPDGGYDIWEDGLLVEPSVTLERAVEVVVKDYKDHKIDRIVTRLCGPDWKSRIDKDVYVEAALKVTTAAIYDDEKQRAASETARKRMMQ